MNDKAQSTISFAQEIDPWIATENLPSFKQDFDRATDPTAKKPDLSYQKEDDRGSGMVKSTQPKNLMQPPEYILNAVLRSSFQNKWLEEQRNAVMRQASSQQNHKQEREHEYNHAPVKQLTYSR